MDETWPIIPFPVSASVASAKMKPIIAALPFNCSEKAVNPCGIFSLLSAIITTLAHLLGTTADALRRDTKLEDRDEVERASTGAAETKAELFMIVV